MNNYSLDYEAFTPYFNKKETFSTKKVVTTTVMLVYDLVVYQYGRISAVRDILKRNEI